MNTIETSTYTTNDGRTVTIEVLAGIGSIRGGLNFARSVAEVVPAATEIFVEYYRGSISGTYKIDGKRQAIEMDEVFALIDKPENRSIVARSIIPAPNTTTSPPTP